MKKNKEKIKIDESNIIKSKPIMIKESGCSLTILLFVLSLFYFL